MTQTPVIAEVPLVLVEKLEYFISDQIEACRQLKPPYCPSIWLRMQKEYGTLLAIWRLLGPNCEGLHSGFKRLAPKHLNLTLEYAVKMHPEIFNDPTKPGWELVWANALINVEQFSDATA